MNLDYSVGVYWNHVKKIGILGYNVHIVYSIQQYRVISHPTDENYASKSTVEVIVYTYNKTYNVHCTGMF